MPWGTPLVDGLFITTVTVPAVAVSFVVSNFRAPLGSAESVTVDAGPAGAVDAAGAAAVVAAVVVLADELESLPHAASPSTPAVARAAAARRGV